MLCYTQVDMYNTETIDKFCQMANQVYLFTDRWIITPVCSIEQLNEHSIKGAKQNCMKLSLMDMLADSLSLSLYPL